MRRDVIDRSIVPIILQTVETRNNSFFYLRDFYIRDLTREKERKRGLSLVCGNDGIYRNIISYLNDENFIVIIASLRFYEYDNNS